MKVTQMLVPKVDVEGPGRDPVVLGHADDDHAAEVVGEGGDILGQFFAALGVRQAFMARYGGGTIENYLTVLEPGVSMTAGPKAP
ncbi:hypothetical protein ACFWA5_51675 [Streptomyces mirabilis]|uniref:hypothetical protein n=1 Tax=Streptomyces mirabilis TaxID=68239 RepID=UPI00364CF9DE